MSDSIKRPQDNRFPVGFDAAEALGWTDKRKQKLVDGMEKAIHHGLKATKVDRVTHKGEVMSEHDDIDHMARLRAAELVGQVTGLRQQTKEVQPVVHITIQTPSWALQGSPKEINPTESHEGEGKPQPD